MKRSVISASAPVPVAQHDVIHHRQGRHQFGPRALRQQRRAGLVTSTTRSRPGCRVRQPADMFDQQRIEMTGYPAGRR